MKHRHYLCSAICLIPLLTGTLLISSGFSPQKSIHNAPKKSTSTKGSARANKGSALGGKKRAAQQAASHCGDSPPANPSNCKLNIDQKFEVGCNLPFQGGVSHDIDQHCPNEGCATKASDKAQNTIKNNLCATGTPVKINFTSIDKLQQAIDRLVSNRQLSYGPPPGGPPQPSARAKLQNLPTRDAEGNAITLGEGQLITLEAFVLDAKHDDTFPFGFGGEGVNCKNSLLEWNDIHIALGQAASSKECSSVTAEIIPHFRPSVWERFDSNPCTSPHITKPLPVKGLQVRITGQLFFDGSHKPSTCSKNTGGGNPRRRSVWEIHPVYKIEVFEGSSFISFEDWAAKQNP